MWGAEQRLCTCVNGGTGKEGLSGSQTQTHQQDSCQRMIEVQYCWFSFF